MKHTAENLRLISNLLARRTAIREAGRAEYLYLHDSRASSRQLFLSRKECAAFIETLVVENTLDLNKMGIFPEETQ